MACTQETRVRIPSGPPKIWGCRGVGRPRQLVTLEIADSNSVSPASFSGVVGSVWLTKRCVKTNSRSGQGLGTPGIKIWGVPQSVQGRAVNAVFAGSSPAAPASSEGPWREGIY